MVSGGERVRSGPAPDPNALARARDGGEWTVLPASGRSGRPPVWPLTEASDRERWWWRRLWSKPQAVQWEKQGQVDEVALYVRRLAAAEQPSAPVNVGTLVRQMADSLGLTIPGMLRLKWHLSKDAPVPAAEDQPAGQPSRSSSRSRFRVIDGEAAS